MLGVPLRIISVGFQSVLRDTPEALAPLAEMPVTDLSVGSGWTDAGLMPLLELRGLTRLTLEHNDELSDAVLGYLRGVPLSELVVDGCPGLTPVGLEHLRGMPLRWLSLESQVGPRSGLRPWRL